MSLSLEQLTTPQTTAVLTMEMQRGIVGDLSRIDELRSEVERLDVVPTTVGLLDAARSAGVAVVHGTVSFRPDRRGSPANAPALAVAARTPDHLLVGSVEASVVPALVAPSDSVVERHHGVCPFTGTSLDALLRSLGIESVVVVGVSVNMGVFGTAIEAVGLGYRVVVVQDAVAGVPREYARDVMTHSIALLARVATADQLIECWTDTGVKC